MHYSSRHSLLRRIQRHLYDAVHPDGAFHERYLRIGITVGIGLGLVAVLIVVTIQTFSADVVQPVIAAAAVHVATH